LAGLGVRSAKVASRARIKHGPRSLAARSSPGHRASLTWPRTTSAAPNTFPAKNIQFIILTSRAGGFVLCPFMSPVIRAGTPNSSAWFRPRSAAGSGARGIQPDTCQTRRLHDPGIFGRGAVISRRCRGTTLMIFRNSPGSVHGRKGERYIVGAARIRSPLHTHYAGLQASSAKNAR